MIVVAIALFYGGVVEKKKMTTIFVTFFDGFAAKNGDGNCCRLFKWFCYKEGDGNNVVTFFYGGGVTKKAMVVSYRRLFFLFFFFFGPFGVVH